MGCRVLSSKSVKSSALTLQGVDDVEGCDSLAARVLGVGDSIPDDVLEEDLQNTSGLLIDKAGDTLDASTTSQSANSGLCDALDVVSEHLSVPLGTSLSCKKSRILKKATRLVYTRSEEGQSSSANRHGLEEPNTEGLSRLEREIPRPFPPLPRPDMLLCVVVDVLWFVVERAVFAALNFELTLRLRDGQDKGG